MVHFATHGNFSSNPEETYILVYGLKDSKGELLRYNDLEKLLKQNDQKSKNTIELLVLSACTTAAGDNRATLGLAGLAVKAGTQSTLATLWKVGDEVTFELMKHFYEKLKTGVSKAEALRQAQKILLENENFQHPKNWAGYILLGNWR